MGKALESHMLHGQDDLYKSQTKQHSGCLLLVYSLKGEQLHVGLLYYIIDVFFLNTLYIYLLTKDRQPLETSSFVCHHAVPGQFVVLQFSVSLPTFEIH